MSTFQKIILAALLLGGVVAEGTVAAGSPVVVVTPNPTTSCSCIATVTVDPESPHVVKETITDSASCTSKGLKPTCYTATWLAEATITKQFSLATPQTRSLPSATPRTTTVTITVPEPIPTPTSTTPIPTSTKSATPSTSSTTSIKSKSSTTSSNPSPNPTPSKVSSKRGLAYNDPRLTQPFSGSKISWAYNWGSTPYASGQQSTGFNPSLEFVPILWSNAPGATSVWSANVKSCISRYSTKAVLAFNEPDQCGNGGSCMKLSDAVSAYQTYMMPLARTVSLGAPAVTNGAAPMGLAYLKSFMSACTNCHFDFFPIHWYGAASDIAGFQAHVGEAFAAVGNKPLWVTEFGTTAGSPADIQNFLQTVSKWMDESGMVARYSFFMTAPGYLIQAGGTALSPLGEMYNSV